MILLIPTSRALSLAAFLHPGKKAMTSEGVEQGAETTLRSFKARTLIGFEKLMFQNFKKIPPNHINEIKQQIQIGYYRYRSYTLETQNITHINEPFTLSDFPVSPASFSLSAFELSFTLVTSMFDDSVAGFSSPISIKFTSKSQRKHELINILNS